MSQKLSKKPITQERPLTFLESYFSPRSVEINPVLDNPSGVFVFDIESDGDRYLVGYSGITNFSYHAEIVADEQDLEVLFSKWLALGYRFGFAYNLKYDLPALLMYARKYSYSHAIRNLGEFYFTKNFEIVRKKLFFEVMRKPTHGEQTGKILFYDLLQYYQTSLEKAYKAFKDVIPSMFKLTEEEKKIWEEDKKKRGSISDVTDADVRYYNSLDVKVTAGLVHVAGENIRRLSKVIRRSISMGVTLPLTAEYAISDNLSMVDYRALDKHDMGDLYTALAISYRGGFFNSPKLGAFYGNLYKYDVNSMYPFMMTLIPTLTYKGRIDHPTEDMIDSPFDLLCGQFHGNTAVPIKVMKQSLVLDHTFGCFWAFEFQPIRFAEWIYEATGNQFVLPMPYDSLKIDHLYTIFKFEPGKQFPLRDPINRIYTERLNQKKGLSPYEKVLKIIMNSSYGKYGEMVYINPSKERLEYASLITAMGRTFINSLVPRDKVITYLTDSIVSIEPLPQEIVGDKLGQLKEETPDFFEVFLNVNNGIYSFMKDRNPLGEFSHTRGFAKTLGNENVAQKFFRDYLDIVETAHSPYEIKIETKKSVMVRTSYMNDVLTKNGNYVEVSTDDLPSRGIKGRLVAIPTQVKGFNMKYVYSPFHNMVSEGTIIKDYFTSFLLHALFLLRDRGVFGTHVKVTPIVKERRNEVDIECKSIDYFRLSLPDAWNVMKILCGEDHPVDRQVSLSAIQSFSTLNEKNEMVRALPLIHPPKRNFITNTAYLQMIRPAYKMHYIKDSDDGIDISDYLPDVVDQANTNTSTQSGKENEFQEPTDELIEDLIMAIDDDIEAEDLTVEY
jgi:hypothetical protein